MWLAVASTVMSWLLLLWSFASWYRERRGLAGFGRASALRAPALCIVAGNIFVLFGIYRKSDLYALGASFLLIGAVWTLLIAMRLSRQ